MSILSPGAVAKKLADNKQREEPEFLDAGGWQFGFMCRGRVHVLTATLADGVTLSADAGEFLGGVCRELKAPPAAMARLQQCSQAGLAQLSTWWTVG